MSLHAALVQETKSRYLTNFVMSFTAVSDNSLKVEVAVRDEFIKKEILQ